MLKILVAPLCASTSHLVKILLLNNYHLPRELWEGNVFSHMCLVCLSRGDPMWPLPMMHWISPYRDGLPVPPYRNPMAPAPVSDIWWSGLETCSNLLTWGTSAPPVLTSGGYRGTYGGRSYWNALLLVICWVFCQYVLHFSLERFACFNFF